MLLDLLKDHFCCVCFNSFHIQLRSFCLLFTTLWFFAVRLLSWLWDLVWMLNFGMERWERLQEWLLKSKLIAWESFGGKKTKQGMKGFVVALNPSGEIISRNVSITSFYSNRFIMKTKWEISRFGIKDSPTLNYSRHLLLFSLMDDYCASLFLTTHIFLFHFIMRYEWPAWNSVQVVSKHTSR